MRKEPGEGCIFVVIEIPRGSRNKYEIDHEAGEDAKVICVPPKEPRWADVQDLEDLSPALRAEIQHFFEVYKALEPDKYSSTLGMAGREAAWREIEDARANYGS